MPAIKSGARGAARGERRAIVDAIFDVVRSGGTWRQRPHDFPPWQTVFYDVRTWRRAGTLEAVHSRLRERLRRTRGRATTPSAALIDRHSVKTTERGAAAKAANHRLRRRQASEGP